MALIYVSEVDVHDLHGPGRAVDRALSEIVLRPRSHKFAEHIRLSSVCVLLNI